MQWRPAAQSQRVLGVASASAQSEVQVPSQQQSVDLNSASAEQLASTLVGVGAAKAQAIIRYRDEVGPFRSVEELEEVKGIGSSIVKRNKARISVSNPKG
jgi:competence protein ComEA